MSLIGGLLKIATSPIRAVVNVVDEVSGGRGEENQMLSIGTLGLSSAIKGLSEGIKEGLDDLDD